MTINLGDSAVYRHLWSTDEARALLGEEARFRAWLKILAALADAQAELGLIPEGAAVRIREYAESGTVDLDLVATETRATGHSTLGLIRFLRDALPDEAREWVYYGATVQDLTDTWTAVVMQKVGDIVDRDLARLERAVLSLASSHRNTPMMGRTHAQPGLPIPFGFKPAVWCEEVRRHRRRLAEGRSRWELVQLGGALGTLEFWGDKGPDLMASFAANVGLGVPRIPWITSRDGPAEFVHLLAMIASTIAKIGNEIMELQRLEIGEVREPFIEGTVGSITMPQKRNPEISEHLDTIARLVRADSGIMVESMVHLHERDGRAWKAEWIALPEACTLVLTSLRLVVVLIEGLEVDEDRMLANIRARRGFVFAEPVMRHLAERVGKHTAHDIVYEACMRGWEEGWSFAEALVNDPRVRPLLDLEGVEELSDLEQVMGAGPYFVDRVTGATD